MSEAKPQDPLRGLPVPSQTPPMPKVQPPAGDHTEGKLYVVEIGTNSAAPSGCELVVDDVDGGNPERDYFLFSAVHGDPDELAANARRLVACWNACDGISTNALQGMPAPFGELLSLDFNGLIAQRDDLLTLLSECKDWLGAAPTLQARVTASIADAKGGATSPQPDPQAQLDQLLGASIAAWWKDAEYLTTGERGEYKVFDSEPEFVRLAKGGPK